MLRQVILLLGNKYPSGNCITYPPSQQHRVVMTEAKKKQKKYQGLVQQKNTSFWMIQEPTKTSATWTIVGSKRVDAKGNLKQPSLHAQWGGWVGCLHCDVASCAPDPGQMKGKTRQISTSDSSWSWTDLKNPSRHPKQREPSPKHNARPQGRQVWPSNISIPGEQSPATTTLLWTTWFQDLIVLRACQ